MRKLTAIPVHPGEVLQDIIESYGLSQTAFAEHINEKQSKINEICRGRRGITPVMAIKLAAAFGQSPQFWLNLQSNFDLSEVEKKEVPEITRLRA